MHLLLIDKTISLIWSILINILSHDFDTHAKIINIRNMNFSTTKFGVDVHRKNIK